MNKLFMDLLARQGTEDLEVELGNGDTAIIVPETAEAIAEMAADNAVAEAAEEVKEHADEIDALVEKVEELEDDVEELQEVVEGAEALLKPGAAWNPLAFSLLYTHGQKLLAKMSPDEVPVMGTESLVDATTAELSARGGLEAMTDTVKKWGSQAVAYIKMIWDKLISFIKGLINEGTAVKNKAKALTARLEKTEKLKETIKLGKWNAYVGLGASGSDKSPSGLSTLLGAAGKVVAGSESLLSSPGNAAALAGPMKALSEAAAGLDSSFGPGKKSGGEKAVAMHNWRGLTIAVGYYAGKIESFEDVSKAAKAIRISSKPNQGVKTDGEFKITEGKDGLKKYISSAVALVDSLASTKVEANYGAAKRDRIIGLLKAADNKEDAGKAISAVKSAQACLSSVSTSVTRLGVSVAKGELAYVAACL